MADKGIANCDPFFESKFRFPWDLMDLSVPSWGGPHSYICSAVAPYYPEPLRSLMKDGMSRSEMIRFAGAYEDPIFKNIVEHCEKHEDNAISTAQKVLYFLKYHEKFRAELQHRIDKGVREGTITIPKDCEKQWRHSNGW